MKSANFFISGTDTNIGKTVLSFLMMSCLFNKGLTPFYLKPFQTGCQSPLDDDSDATFIYKHIPQLKGKDPAQSVVYCLRNPKAPFFAAMDENIIIDTEKITDIIATKSRSFNPLVIEGAGGLFVPIDKKTMIIDIAEKTGAKIVLAARAGLGTINHTLLSLEALKSRGIVNPAVVLLNPKKDSVPEELIKENSEAIELMSGVKPAGVINHIDDFSTIDSETFAVIERIIS